MLFRSNGEDRIAVGWLKRKKLADIVRDGDSNMLVLTDEGKKTVKRKMPAEELLSKLSKGLVAEKDAERSIIKELKGRGDMIREFPETRRDVSLTDKGSEIARSGLELKKEITDITDRIIQSGEWKGAEFRRYDVNTFAPAVYPAKRSPITRLTDQVREMFMDMGFTEIDRKSVV